MGKYLEVRESDGLCVNAIAWDGESPYDPGDGIRLVPLVQEVGGPWIGWRLVDGEWIPPEPAPE